MENVLYRVELGRPLTYEEIDNNFKYVSNPWSPVRIYKTGMIIYHDLVAGSYILYRANKTTTEGTFDITEWDSLNNNVIRVIHSAEDTLADFIVNEFDPANIKIGDYLVTATEDVYLLYQNLGGSVNDYIVFSRGSESITTTNVFHSSESSLTDFIVNDWDDTIEAGDVVILASNLIYMLTQGNGSLSSNYVLLSTSNIEWVDIIGKPNSSSSEIDDAVSLMHSQNTDTYLDFGGVNEVTAANVRTHIDDTTIHFTMAEIAISHDQLINIGTYQHSEIDSHIDDDTIHFIVATIDHALILNSGTQSHAEIDLHMDGYIYTHAEIDTHVGSGYYVHYEIDSHIDDLGIHYLQTDISHLNLTSIGNNSHNDIDAHINNTSIHLDGTSIDHLNLSNIGTHTHIEIDTHIEDIGIHYLQSEIDHQNLISSGFYNHYEIDNHIEDISIHLPPNLIDHFELINSGLQTHENIDDHINDHSIHAFPGSIDHFDLTNKGVYTHVEIDTFIDSIATHITNTIPLVSGAGLNSVKMLNNNIVTGANSFVMGSNNIISSINSAIIGGSNNTLDASATNSVMVACSNETAIQPNTLYTPRMDILDGMFNVGNAKFANWIGNTSNDATVELFLKDSTRFLINLNSAIMFKLDIVAYNSLDEVAKLWEIRGGIRHDATGTLYLIGNSFSKYMISQDGAYDVVYDTENWEAVVAVDNLNQSLKISVTGEATKSINWSVAGYVTVSNI